jgi:hypothetical protein
MLKNLSREDKLLMLGYGAIAIAYGILFTMKLKQIKAK